MGTSFRECLASAWSDFRSIPELEDRLVAIPNPEVWLFNEEHFRDRFVSMRDRIGMLPAAVQSGIRSSPDYTYQEYMFSTFPSEFGAALRSAYHEKRAFVMETEFQARGGGKGAPPPGEAVKEVPPPDEGKTDAEVRQDVARAAAAAALARAHAAYTAGDASTALTWARKSAALCGSQSDAQELIARINPAPREGSGV